MKLPKHLEVVIREMCKVVGADFDRMDSFGKDKDGNLWFQQYTWTQKESDAFGKWFKEYLSKNKEARQEFMTHPSKDKKYLECLWQEVNLQWGWKLAD